MGRLTSAPTTGVLGVELDTIEQAEAVELISGWLEGLTGQAYVVTPNAEIIDQAQRDTALREQLNRAALAVPDSVSVVRAMQQRGSSQRDRVAGVDLMQALCERAASSGWRIFLLGAAEGVAEAAAERLRVRFQGLTVVGCYAGQAGSVGDAPARAVLEQTGAIDLLFVAYGAPKQEAWIARNLPRLPAVRLAMTVGGSLDMLAGRLRRAPAMLRRLGLEWAWRMLLQPSRWPRMVRVMRFVWQARKEALHADRV